jgi:hypothetical protein
VIPTKKKVYWFTISILGGTNIENIKHHFLMILEGGKSKLAGATVCNYSSKITIKRVCGKPRF